MKRVRYDIRAREIKVGDEVYGFNTPVESVIAGEASTTVLFRSGYKWSVESDQRVAVLRPEEE